MTSTHVSPLRSDIASHSSNHSHNNPHNASPESSTAAVASTDSSSFISNSNKQKNSNDNTSPFSAEGTSPIMSGTTTLATNEEEEEMQSQPEPPEWHFPKTIPPPDKDTLQSMYQQAMQLQMQSKNDNNNNNNKENPPNYADQQQLSRYGILSLADVMLPALSHQHNQVLKNWQAILMRDDPDLVTHVTEARQALYQVTAEARQAALEARDERCATYLPLLEKERLEQEQQDRLAQERVRALKRLSQQRECQKKYPRNKELWQELAFLASELPKLEKEQKIWTHAQQELQSSNANKNGSTVLLNKTPLQQMDADAMDVEDEEEEDGNHTASVVASVHELQLANTRVRQAVQVVETALQQTHALRGQVAHWHQQERFGIMGNGRQTQALVKLMSQEE